MEMETEKTPNTNPDIGSEVPPSYPGSTAYQTPVIPAPDPYPATFGSELPPSYPGSSSAISQPKVVVTSQPSRQRYSFSALSSENAANHVLYLSVCWCVACFLCGSPLTIICFVPAILLAMQGRQYASNGEPDRAKKAICSARVLAIVGIFSGIAVVTLVIVLRSLSNSDDEESSNQE